MKIACTYLNDEIFQHFGKSEYFAIYEVENNEIRSKQIVHMEGTGHGGKSKLLKEANVEVLLCGGMGMHAKESLDANGIKVLPGVAGNADQAVTDYLHGKLIINNNAIHACCH